MTRIFTSLQIDTCSHCTRACAWCPVSRYPRPAAFLPLTAIERIVQDAVDGGWNDSLHFGVYSEPVADGRLVKILETVRPIFGGTIQINTNGDLLNGDLCRALFNAGLSRMLWSEYGTAAPLRAKHLAGQFERIALVVKPPESLSDTRGGLVPPVRQVSLPLRAICRLVDHEMTVTATGEVALCCEDYKITYPIGNVEDESIVDLWRSDAFERARGILLDESNLAGCRYLPMCKLCNKG